MEDVHVTPQDVWKKLSKLNTCTSKSQGPDGIHPRVLFELKDHILTPLAHIFINSLDTGQLPEIWKQANISPIFKKGSKKNPSNYRPVSLTFILCKILETFMRQNI